MVSATAAGCSNDPDALILRLDVADAAKLGVDALEVSVEQGESVVFTQIYAVPADAKLPGTLTLQSGAKDAPSGTLTPKVLPVSGWDEGVTVKVKARSAEATRTVKSALFHAPPPGLRRLSFTFDASCIDVVCDDASTCDQGKCVSNDIDISELPVVSDATP
jgi:hypothetical protein